MRVQQGRRFLEGRLSGRRRQEVPAARERHQTIGNAETIERAVQAHGLTVGNYIVTVAMDRDHGCDPGTHVSKR